MKRYETLGILLISTHIKALRGEILIWILKTLWHFPDRKPYHWSEHGRLAIEKSLHLLSLSTSTSNEQSIL